MCIRDRPKAMAEAFRNGNLGIMDYYRMKNIEADRSEEHTSELQSRIRISYAVFCLKNATNSSFVFADSIFCLLYTSQPEVVAEVRKASFRGETRTKTTYNGHTDALVLPVVR